MELGHFGLFVRDGKEVEGGYVQMQHNTEYKLHLLNSGSEDADATITIDGTDVGTFRIAKHSRAIIGRPVHAQRNFLFLKAGTSEAQQAGLQVNNSLGLITVKFIPAKKEEFVLLGPKYLSYNPTRGGMKGASAGGTGLGSTSDQSFVNASRLELDHSRAVTLHLRLICVEPQPAIIPLRPSSTPIPLAL